MDKRKKMMRRGFSGGFGTEYKPSDAATNENAAGGARWVCIDCKDATAVIENKYCADCNNRKVVNAKREVV